jgi:hypothetical protein
MKKYLLSGLLFIFLILPAFTQDNPTVRIVNNTGYTVYYVYISQIATDDWEEDVLGDDVLTDGHSVNISLKYPLDVTNRYDIKLEDEDGDTYTKWDVLISQGSTVEFTIGDLDVSSASDQSSTVSPVVHIINNTGYTVYYVYVSQSSADDWHEDVLEEDVLLDGQSVGVTLAYPLDVVNRYDIKLEDEDGDTYTKWDLLISPESNIEFTIGDLD